MRHERVRVVVQMHMPEAQRSATLHTPMRRRVYALALANAAAAAAAAANANANAAVATLVAHRDGIRQRPPAAGAAVVRVCDLREQRAAKGVVGQNGEAAR